MEKKIKKSLAKKDIYYIVAIKDDKVANLRMTTINKEFCGRVIKTADSNIFFKLNGSGAKVTIPIGWIEYLAPSKVLWEQMRQRKCSLDKDERRIS